MLKIKVGVIGLGYWGPNYIRNFHRHPLSEISWGCDIDERYLQKIHCDYPLIKLTNKFQDLLKDPALDLIAIATPPKSHYQLATAALNAGKHVILAKPLTTNLRDAKKLLNLARKKKLLLQSDLTYLYSSSIRALKKTIVKGAFGQPVYFDSIRANAGPIRDDANVIWDLAPHDLAILDFLFNLKPKTVFASGSKHYKKSITEEMAHIILTYPKNFVAHIHLSWLSPIKTRTITLSGSKKMIFFNDSLPEEKLRIYDSQIIDVEDKSSSRKLFYQNGDITIPNLKNDEPLFTEVDEIITNIRKNKINYQNAQLSVRIIKILEAIDKSLSQHKTINL